MTVLAPAINGHDVVSLEELPERAFRPVRAIELLAKRISPIRWAVEDIIPEGLVLLAGKPKMGKSWLALALGLSVASGRSLIDGMTVQQGDVLYLGLEDTERRLRDRLRLLLGDRYPPEGLELVTSCPRLDQGGSQHIAAWLEAHPQARLVVVDTLALVRTPPRARASLYQEDYDALRTLKQLADARRITLLVVHHLRKGSAEDPLDEISGSTGLTGAADALLVLQRTRGQSEALVRVTGRDVEEQELPLRFDAETGRWSIQRAKPSPTHPPQPRPAQRRAASAARAAVRCVLETAAAPLSPGEISAQTGTSLAATRVLLSQMARAGEIERPARGQYCAMASTAA